MPTERNEKRSAVLLALLFSIIPAFPLERPWICDTYFYWYTWDYDKKLGNWLGGVYNTPLSGYYDSRTYKDNKRSLRQACEWGITHHFIDYWSPDWLGEGGVMREKILFKAAEDLQKEGYDIWMSYYQDGWNFDTKYFSNNISQKRDTYLWLQLFSSSPVLVRLNGLPFKLIYSRNGFPQTTIDNEGFRSYLRSIYPSIDDLNKKWGTNFSSFEEINMNFNTTGHQRAFSIKYQYEIWKREWEKLDKLVQKEFNLPGMRVSFDVGYEPFMGFSYSLFTKTLGGPHSYGGIFGQPQEQDVQRFIQSIVAKKYNTVFFDHFKNYYTDWEIRIPGTCYPPEPLHFDRFWCSALLRYSEALLHLSWNEWWEGSNLEPCYEYGKKFCEKNLFWATLMWEIFPSLKNFGKNAKVALILNEWPLLSGEGNIQELYQTIQILRQLNVPFDLIPDDLLDEKILSRFKIVIAPSCGVGFGYNQNNEEILNILLRWLQSGNRKLFISGTPQIGSILGLRERRETRKLPRGEDLNVFVDVGEKGDEKFILKGTSSREDWGALPPEAFGKSERRLTVRWLPGSGTRTVFLLPLSPSRDLILRFRATALWDNEITVLLNGKEAGKIQIVPDWHIYELKIPSQLVDDYIGELVFDFKKANIPSQLDPKRFPSENRVCNIALDWLQLSTPNFSAEERKSIYSIPKNSVVFQKDFLPLSFPIPLTKIPFLYPARGNILSHYKLSNAPRDIVIPYHQSEVYYINGSLSGILDKRYWRALFKWAGLEPPEYVSGENVIGNVYWSGNTAFVLAYNFDITKQPSVSIRLPAKRLPIAEAIALNKDGNIFQQVKVEKEKGFLKLNDKISYFSSYAFVFSPLKLLNTSFAIVQGDETSIPLEIQNLTAEPQKAIVHLRARFPSLASEEINISLKPQERKIFNLPLKTRDEIDWGRKTVVIEFEGNWGKSVFIRPLLVMDKPNIAIVNKVVDFKKPILTIKNEANPYIQTATAQDLSIDIAGKKIKGGDLKAGKELKISLPSPSSSSQSPSLLPRALTISYFAGHKRLEKKETIYFALYPPSLPSVAGAIRPILIFNSRLSPLDNEIVAIPWKEGKASVKNEKGFLVSHHYRDGTLYFIATVPPQGFSIYYLTKSEPSPSTDLSLKREGSLVRIENSYFSLAFDENKGGSLISFISKLTNKDYAGGIFGASYGEFGRFDPLNPAITSDKFIKDDLKHQSEGRGKIQILDSSPLSISLLITYEDEAIKARQYVEVYAFKDFFRVRSEVEPKRKYPETIPFSLRLNPHSLSKIYPNFIGIESNEPSPHFGWRQGSYVPPYITLMQPERFPESISLILKEKANVSDVRYGFFPPQRGKAGPRSYAWVEFINKEGKSCFVDLLIKLHPGYQVVAEEEYENLKNPPLILFPKEIKLGKVQSSYSYSPPWLDTYRRNRLEITVIPKEELLNEIATLKLPLREDIVESSPKVVEINERMEVIGERPCVFDKASGELRFLLNGKSEAGKKRYFLIYYSRGGKEYPKLSSFMLPGENLLNPSFENEGGWWSFNNAQYYTKEAHSGKGCALLSLPTGQGFSLITNDSLNVMPNAKYKVSFYAKVLEGKGILRTNFYWNEKYDFEQIVVPLINDGEWHRYEVEVPTGYFPPEINPFFRLWAIGSPQVVLVDDVEVSPLHISKRYDIIMKKEEELR